MKDLPAKLSFLALVAVWCVGLCLEPVEAMAADASHMMSKGDVTIYLAVFGGVCVGLIALIIRSSPKDDDFNEPWGM